MDIMQDRLITTNLEYYKAFYYAAKFGTITAAAQKLCLTQPTVTNAIQKLEEQLKVSLFVRNKKGVQLTHEGKILWNRVEPALQLLLSGEEELEETKNLEGGSLKIISTEMSCLTYIIPSLMEFTRDYPKVKIKLRNALTENMIEQVRTGELDMAILHTPFEAGEDLELRFLHKIEECFVAGPKYKFLGEGIHTIEELSKYPMISLPDGAATKEFIRGVFEKHGLVFNPDFEMTTIGLVIAAVEHNLGIGDIPTIEAERWLNEGSMVRINVDEPPMERSAYVIYSRKIPLTPAAQTFLENYLLKNEILNQ